MDNAANENVDTGSEAFKVFDASKWKTKVGQDYPYRKEMLENLVYEQPIRELKRDSLLELLGKPDRMDGDYHFYQVEQKRLGLWPLHTRTMVVNFKQDSTVNWVKIHE